MSVEIPLGGEKVSVDMLRAPKTSDDVMVKLDAHQIEYIIAFIRMHGLAYGLASAVLPFDRFPHYTQLYFAGCSSYWRLHFLTICQLWM